MDFLIIFNNIKICSMPMCSVVLAIQLYLQPFFTWETPVCWSWHALYNNYSWAVMRSNMVLCVATSTRMEYELSWGHISACYNNRLGAMNSIWSMNMFHSANYSLQWRRNPPINPAEISTLASRPNKRIMAPDGRLTSNQTCHCLQRASKTSVFTEG